MALDGVQAPGGAEMPEDVEALLLKGGGFVLCDAKVCPKVKGLPVRFASEQFLDMLGFSDTCECVGQAWLDVLPGGGCKGQEGLCSAVMQTGCMSADAAAAAVETLANHFREVTKRLATSSPSSNKSAAALALARQSTGKLFVCELAVSVREHPTLRWAYLVGLHRDISEEISVARLLAAASNEDVCAGRVDLASALGVDLGYERTAKSLEVLNGSNIPGFLNARAGEMWQTLISDMMRGPGNPDEKLQKASRRMAARSVASGSTSASRQSRMSRRSCASADTEWDWEASRALQEPSTMPVGCHLGALLGAGGFAPAVAGAPSKSGAAASCTAEGNMELSKVFRNEEHGERFLDLLEEVSGGSGPDDPNMVRGRAKCEMAPILEMPLLEAKQQLSPPSPMSPVTPKVMGPNSAEVQKVIETMGKKELQDLDFPFVMADPSKPGCPLVVCSAGFQGLTGYSSWEALGRSMVFQLCGVPDHLVCQEQRSEVSEFLEFASRGEFYPGGDHTTDEVNHLTEGELVTVQTHARRSGELFTCMTYLKQVELEDDMFVIGLQARVPDPTIDPEEHDVDAAEENPCARLALAFNQLSKNVDVAVHVLAAQFWYSAPMRRQSAASSDSEFERD